MKCPACSSELSEVNVTDITLDICKDGCGGIWFDHGEIEHFNEKHETLPKELLLVKRQKNITLNSFPRKCPRCCEEHLIRQSYDPQNPVEIDMCWRCGGIWVDIGELDTIRKDGGNREAAGNAFLQSSLHIFDLAKIKKGEYAEHAQVDLLLAKLRDAFFDS